MLLSALAAAAFSAATANAAAERTAVFSFFLKLTFYNLKRYPAFL